MDVHSPDFTADRGKEVRPQGKIVILSAAEYARMGRTHWENFKHDTAGPVRIIREAWKNNREEFLSETGEALKQAFSPVLKGPDGKMHFNGRSVVYWSGLSMLIAAGAGVYKYANDSGGDSGSADALSLCAVLQKQAVEHSVDIVAPMNADKTAAVDCFVAKTDLQAGSGGVLGIEADTGYGGKVQLLAVPVKEIDTDGNGSPENAGYRVVGVEAGLNSWKAGKPGVMEADLPEYSLIEGLLVGEETAKLVARNVNGQVVLAIKFGGVLEVPVDIANLAGGADLEAQARFTLGIDKMFMLNGEAVRQFGDDGLMGEGKIGPWMEANKVEPSQELVNSVKALSKDGEAVVLEVKDAEGKTGQMVFVMEKDAGGLITKRFVGWFKDDLGVKRLAENGMINDLDELLPLPGGQGFGVMGADGILEPVIVINPEGQMVLVDGFIQKIAAADRDTRVRINGNEVNTAFEAGAGQVWIEQMGEVEPLDLKMTTEFTIEYEKMPKISWEYVSSGRLRETLLQKWQNEGKLTAKYIEENWIYAVKPEDWREGEWKIGNSRISSYLNVFDANDVLSTRHFDYDARPFRPSPEVFELNEENGESVAMVATTMVVFERPDKTIGIEPWFYYLDKEMVGVLEGWEAECFGVKPSAEYKILSYPMPFIDYDLYFRGIPSNFRYVDEWLTHGYERQGVLLRSVIERGYPDPKIGSELLTAGCAFYK